jgi:hypothetical protein
MHVIEIGGKAGTVAGLVRWAPVTVVMTRTTIAVARMDFIAGWLGSIMPNRLPQVREGQRQRINTERRNGEKFDQNPSPFLGFSV